MMKFTQTNLLLLIKDNAMRIIFDKYLGLYCQGQTRT